MTEISTFGEAENAAAERASLPALENRFAMPSIERSIAKAKKLIVYPHCKLTIDANQLGALKTDGVHPTEIAKRLGISRASTYRVLGAGFAS